MKWLWKYTGADGQPVKVKQADVDFASQGDAETWLGEVWRDIAKQGAAFAHLHVRGAAGEAYALPLTTEAT